MRITRVEIREIRMPLVRYFETSFGRTTERRIVLVSAEAGGFTGWGEVTCGEHPFYSYETPETAWPILREYLVPWCLGREWRTASEVAACFRPIRRPACARRIGDSSGAFRLWKWKSLSAENEYKSVRSKS